MPAGKRYRVCAKRPLANASTFVGATSNTTADPPSSWWNAPSSTVKSQSPWYLLRQRSARVAQPGVVPDLHGAALDHEVESLLPPVGAGGERDVRVPRQVHRLLLRRTRAEVEPAVVPDGRQRRDVRPAVAANRGDPEELGGLEHAEGVRPRRRRRLRITEADVLLGYGFHAGF